MKEKEKGITLTALVITVIILIILAGVGISMISGQNGLFARANAAANLYKGAQQNEADLFNSILNSEYWNISSSGSSSSSGTDNEETGWNVTDYVVTKQEIQEIVQTLTAEIESLKTQSNNILDVYPIGSIYITTSDKNPSELFGGEWEKYAEGRTLIGTGSTTDARSETLSFALGSTGGEYKHVLSVAEMPSHSHSVMVYEGSSRDYNGAGGDKLRYTKTKNTGSAGGNLPHNNMQPYIATHMWQRTK